MDIGGNASDTSATAFVSYCRQDADIALRLARDLKASGASVWLDQLDIVPGQRWDRAVEEALKVCRRMLVIVTPASVESTNVMDEVSFALEEQKVVIPVVYQPCAIPFRLRRLQRIDLNRDYDQGLRDLLRVLSSWQPAPARLAPLAPASVPTVEASISPMPGQTGAAAADARSNTTPLTMGVEREQLATMPSSRGLADVAAIPAVQSAANDTSGLPIGAILLAIPAAWLTGHSVTLALVGLSLTPLIVIGTAGGAGYSLLIAWFGVSVTGSAPFIRFGQLLRICVCFLLAGLLSGFVGLTMWMFGCAFDGTSILQFMGCHDTSNPWWKLGFGLTSGLGLVGASAIIGMELSLTRLRQAQRGDLSSRSTNE